MLLGTDDPEHAEEVPVATNPDACRTDLQCVVAGEILFFCEGEETQHLKPGDLFSVPSGRSHTVQLLTPEARLVDSFTPLRDDFLG